MPYSYTSDFAGGSQLTHSTDIEHTKGKGNKDNIIVADNRYRKDKQRISPKGEVRSYWRCVVNNCNTRIVLKHSKMVNTKMVKVKHMHGSQKAEVAVNRAWQSAKERARTTNETEQKIITETLNSLRVVSNESTIKKKSNTLRRCIRIVRARSTSSNTSTS